MSTDATPKHVFAREIAELRRELAELRGEVAHLIRAGARQEDAFRELGRAVRESSQRLESRLDKLEVVGAVTDYRLELDGDAIERLGADIKRQRRALEDCYQWADAHLRDLQMWMGSLAERVWPKMGAFIDELGRILPKGWALVSDHRLAKKSSPNG
jgi:hypothetical protein